MGCTEFSGGTIGLSLWLPKIPSENKEVPINREIMVATTMSSLFVALFALVASSFRTRAALQAEILALRHQLAILQKNAPRRLRFHRCDRFLWVGGDVCRWFSPTRSSVGTAELSPGIGLGNRAALPEGQKLPRTFVI
ncbi:MAG: hypothetical protein DMG32_16950 [Acidobacteria bacterium]|nr:MAG: hypothetical protein DMG32_16950 [Acidobacteriota bacterium]